MTDFKPMLAKDAVPEKLRFPLVVQAKLDGIRCCIYNGKPVSRTLKDIPNLEIQAALSRPEFEGLDGELIVGDPTAEGCMQRTSSFVMTLNKTGEPWSFHVFDKWDESGPFIDRYEAAGRIVTATTWTDLPLFMVANRYAIDADALEKIELEHLEQGHEGVIVRDPHGTYKFGRSYPKDGKLLKVKRFIDFEAQVIGVYEKMHNANEAKTNLLGRTERSTAKAGLVPMGTLGGLVLVAINGPHKGQQFRCGTGFNDAQRAELWAEAWQDVDRPGAGHTRDGLNDRVAKVKSFLIGSKDAPRFPVWLGFRNMEIDG